MNGLKSRCRRMSANVVMVKIPVTIEEVAKARNFGASVDDGFLFILRKGLTNPGLLFLREGFNKPSAAASEPKGETHES